MSRHWSAPHGCVTSRPVANTASSSLSPHTYVQGTWESGAAAGDATPTGDAVAAVAGTAGAAPPDSAWVSQPAAPCVAACVVSWVSGKVATSVAADGVAADDGVPPVVPRRRRVDEPEERADDPCD